jgi:hypothetical protein
MNGVIQFLWTKKKKNRMAMQSVLLQHIGEISVLKTAGIGRKMGSSIERRGCSGEIVRGKEMGKLCIRVGRQEEGLPVY